MRRYAREVAFSLLFEHFFNDAIDIEDLSIFDTDNLSKEDVCFLKELYNGAISNLEEYFEKISNLSKGFKLDRIFKIDLAILSIAMYELEKTTTPKAVVINEAVDMAKKYSTKKSVGFVNGILGEYVKEHNDNYSITAE